MRLTTAPADGGRDLGLGKTNDNNKEEVGSSYMEDEDGSANKINVEIKDTDNQKQQEQSPQPGCGKE